MAETPDCDVLIAGGGPAGSTLAALLARAGLKTVMAEGVHFPRQHIGESLVPAVMPVLQESGALDTVAKAGFSIKRGACWTTPSRYAGMAAKSGGRPFRHVTTHFSERIIADRELSYTYHVP